MDNDKKDGAGRTAFDLILERIQALSNVLMVILLVGLTLLLGASISMRYFIGQPISWANAISLAPPGSRRPGPGYRGPCERPGAADDPHNPSHLR